MPSSKGGAQSRKNARKKPAQAKKISAKKYDKSKKRIAEIKSRGNKCNNSPMQLSKLSVVNETYFTKEKKTLSTPAEVDLFMAVFCEWKSL